MIGCTPSSCRPRRSAMAPLIRPSLVFESRHQVFYVIAAVRHCPSAARGIVRERRGWGLSRLRIEC